MEIILSEQALEHIQFWKESNNVAVQKKISELKDAIIYSPFKGIGKPEALKYQLTGKWSRHITKEHRFVYSIEKDKLIIYSLKGHY